MYKAYKFRMYPDKHQKELARKKKRSNNYFKCKEKLNKLYIKLHNARKYYLHKITRDITNEYDIICTEDLNTKKMLMEKEISKKIADAEFAEILRQLEYKAKEKGKYFFKINTYFASSQICSICQSKNKKYKNINERIYKCSNCHNILDRDLNASINIMCEGLNLFMKKYKYA